METVAVKLTSAWPTDQGLRRPLEGSISFPVSEAIRIVDAGCGEIASEADKKIVATHKAAAKKAKAEKAKAEKLAAKNAAAEQAEAEKLAAEKAEAEKAAAEKLAAEQAAQSAQS